MISNIDKSEAIPMLFIPKCRANCNENIEKGICTLYSYTICEKKCHFAQFQLQGLQMKWS